MNVYLLKDYSTHIFTSSKEKNQQRGFKVGEGSLRFSLRDGTMDSSGTKGVLQENRFPWKVQSLQDTSTHTMGNLYFTQASLKDNSFDIRFNCTITKESCPPNGLFSIELDGDFVKILKYVYSTDSLPEFMKLSFKASLTVPNSEKTVPINFEILSTSTDCVFKGSFQLTSGLAQKLITTRKINLENLTIQLVGEDVEPSAEPVTAVTARKTFTAKSEPKTAAVDSTIDCVLNLNRRILIEKIMSDFLLVASNGLEIPTHKNFLAAHSPVFKKMFETACVETQTNRCQLNLTKEGLLAFIVFVYSFELNTSLLNAPIAAELLRFSHEKDMPVLEGMVKDLLMRQPESWFEFDASLHIFLHCTKLDLYEDLKIKVVKAIKLKKDEMEKSEMFKEFLKTDTETAVQLFSQLSSQ